MARVPCSGDRQRERERKERGEMRGEMRVERDTSASPIPGFSTKKMKAIVRKEAKNKGKRPQRRQVTFIQAKKGDKWPNDQAERAKDRGGCVFGWGWVAEVTRDVLGAAFWVIFS